MKQNMRETAKAALPRSRRWASKVDKMSDSQMVAVYMRLKLEARVA